VFAIHDISDSGGRHFADQTIQWFKLNHAGEGPGNDVSVWKVFCHVDAFAVDI
jgi:hypothetical protein